LKNYSKFEVSGKSNLILNFLQTNGTEISTKLLCLICSSITYAYPNPNRYLEFKFVRRNIILSLNILFVIDETAIAKF